MFWARNSLHNKHWRFGHPPICVNLEVVVIRRLFNRMAPWSPLTSFQFPSLLPNGLCTNQPLGEQPTHSRNGLLFWGHSFKSKNTHPLLLSRFFSECAVLHPFFLQLLWSRFGSTKKLQNPSGRYLSRGNRPFPKLKLMLASTLPGATGAAPTFNASARSLRPKALSVPRLRILLSLCRKDGRRRKAQGVEESDLS